MPALDHKRLQELAESVAYAQNPDGTWKLNRDKANELFEMIKGYVRKSAERSDWFDPDNAVGDINLNIWTSLGRYGPRYQNKPFAEYLKTKVNNVLTNNWKKRTSHKSKLNYPDGKAVSVESIDGMVSEDSEGNFAGFSKLPKTDPVDLIALREALTGKHKAKLARIIEHEERTRDMPQKLTVTELVEYARRLPNEEKHKLCLELWALSSGISVRSLRRTFAAVLTPLFKQASKKKNLNPKYNPPGAGSFYSNESDPIEQRFRKFRVEFKNVVVPENEKEHSMPRSLEGCIDVGDGIEKQCYVTPYDRKIQIVSKTAKSATVKILLTEEVLEVPLSYKIRPLEEAMSEHKIEDPIEQSIVGSEDNEGQALSCAASKSEPEEVVEEESVEEEVGDEDDEEEVEEVEDEEAGEEEVEEEAAVEDEEEDAVEEDAAVDKDPKKAEVEEDDEIEEDDEDVEDEDEDGDGEEGATVEEDEEEDEEEEEDDDEEEVEDEDEESEETDEDADEEDEPPKKARPAGALKRGKKMKANKKHLKKVRKEKLMRVSKKKSSLRKMKAKVAKRLVKVKAPKQAARHGTAKDLVLNLLRKGEYNREDLAQAIIKKGLSDKKIDKVKNYVSVMLSNLKKERVGLKVLERGLYTINK